MNRRHLRHSTARLILIPILAASAIRMEGQTAAAIPTLSLTDVLAAPVAGRGGPVAASPPVLPGSIVFDAATVGGAPQQVTATIALSGRSSNRLPRVSVHYGHDYIVGAVACTSSGAGEVCSVPVTFQPTLPGGRPDALFFFDGTARLGAVPLFGIGNAPLALLDGVEPVAASAAELQTGRAPAVVDEDDTLFVLDPVAGTVTATESDGVRRVLPIAGLNAPTGLAIDGTGVLYVLDASPVKALTIFDTVRDLQGSIALPVPAASLGAIACGGAGTLFALSAQGDTLYAIHPDQSVSTTAIDPLGSAVAGSRMLATAHGDLVVGGDSLRVIGSTRTQAAPRISSAAGKSGVPGEPIGVDAASAIYATSATGLDRLSGTASNPLPMSLSPALALGRQGRVYLADSTGTSMVDRGEATLDFGGVPAGAATAPRLATLYNGGNQPLTIATIDVAGEGFSLVSLLSSSANGGVAAVNLCVAGSTVAPGATCAIAVALRPSRGGASSGEVTIRTDSLNSMARAQVVHLRANVATGSQAVLSPSSLSFPSTTVNVASAPMTITLSNPGTVALNFTSLGLGGVGSGSYSLTHTCFTALPASLAPGASCVLTATFKPLSAAAQTATISIGDDAGGASATQTAVLSGTGTPAPAPKITFTPAAVTFGSTGTVPANWVVAGTTAPPAMVTITNTGNATANISSISLTTTLATLPYTQANTCGPTLAASATCVVTITFSPTLPGTAETASLVVTDDAIGSPQIEPVTGIATAGDYTLSADQTTLTIPSTGGTATMNLTATPSPAPFPPPINFSVFGLPNGASYTFSPNMISAVQAANSSALTITLPAYHPVNLSRFDPHPQRRYIPVAAIALGGICVGFRRRWLPRLASLLCLFVLGLTSLSGCGGIPVASGVAPGAYVLTITALSANGVPTTPATTVPAAPASTHTAIVNLTVQ